MRFFETNRNGIELHRFPFYYSLCFFFFRMKLDDGNDFHFRKR